jgi:hypothetical protein
MAEVVTFVGYRPPQRFDEIPWTEARIEEAAAVDGSYTQLEAVPLAPVDTDPAQPLSRSFTTELGTAIDYWYRIIWADATGDTSVPTTPVQNVAGGSAPPTVVAYATVDELARILQLSSPSAAQTVAMQRCLDAAAAEIDSYLAPVAPYYPPYPPLVVQVNLERAVDHWKAEQSPFGIVALGGESPPSYTGRNSWRRHANSLLSLKSSFGVG